MSGVKYGDVGWWWESYPAISGMFGVGSRDTWA